MTAIRLHPDGKLELIINPDNIFLREKGSNLPRGGETKITIGEEAMLDTP